MPKFTYMGKNAIIVDSNGNEKEVAANCYGGNKLKNGDVVELDGWLAEKAENNQNYQRIKPGPKTNSKSQIDIL